MKNSKLTALILCFIMLISLLPYNIALAETDTDAEKGQRRVYLHAFNEAPALNTSEIRHTVYMGEDVNVFLAVDNPNKGDYLAADHPNVETAAKEAREKAAAEAAKNPNFTTEKEKLDYIDYEVAKAVQLERHAEPQYDMQGYTVKIYFDTRYFEFKNSKTPLDFKVPNKTNGFEIVDGEEIKIDTSLNPGYMTHKPSYKCDSSEREGYAAATVFLMGNGFFPNKTDDLWYNLCKLTLTPKTTGSTSVRIEYDMGTDDDLELFAKNVTDEKLNFDAEVLNDGVFYINIEEAGRPSRPLATIPGGTYNDKIDVQLYHTNSDPCEIYYSIDGTDPRNTESNSVKLYSENEILDFESNTVLKARVYRPSDEKWSDLATFTYEFLPRAPYLFNSRYEQIPNIYSEIWKDSNTGYYVYTADNKVFSQGISAGNKIYYTFDEDLSPEYVKRDDDRFVGENPETQWVEVNPISQRLDAIIDCSRTVRLVTENRWGISETATYHLGIKPAPVTATPGSGLDVELPIILECDTSDAKIYYTTNGDDPRKETKFEYTDPIYFEEDTVIKAVSLYDGQWSDVTSFWYIFTGNNRSGVSAVYPSGIYTGSVEVILYSDEPGKDIEVSFDGGKTWEDYDGTIMGDTTTVDKHIEFNARIKSDDNTDEDLGDKFVYIIKPLAPVFSPESCEFTAADIVTVFSPESTNTNRDRFELWYSLDGSEPDGSLKAPENDVVNIPVTGYTKIKAVVVKDNEYMSEVVEHTYNVVYEKPAKPTVTLPSGYYTREFGSEEFVTMFVTPPDGIEIYYTIGNRNEPFDAPDLTMPGGAIKYNNGAEITVTNDTMIKAVAVQNINGNIVKSDISIFDYIITPQAPEAAKSSVVKELPLVPVYALAVESDSDERCYVEYKIGNESEGYENVRFCVDEENSDGYIKFYIDTKTGNAYADEDKNDILYLTERSDEFTDSIIIEINTVLDDEKSESNAYAYIIGDDETPLTPPFADKESGTYTESKTPFKVNFYSIYEDREDISIEWKYDGDENWITYDPSNPPEFDTVDKIIYARTVDEEGNESPSVGYIYTFNPPEPIITPQSGIYQKNDNKKSVISQSDDIDSANIGDYEIYYRLATDDTWARMRGNNTKDYFIDKTMTVMAYTYNRITGRVSNTVSRSYIVEDENTVGAITIKWPFNQSRISAHKLGKDEYANGIQFMPENDVYYEYAYTLTPESGNTSYKSDTIAFDKDAAFVPTERIDYMTIVAWINGDKNNTEIHHSIDFVHLNIPETDLPEKSEYDKNTKYHVVNEYAQDPTIIVYYTTNKSDPTIKSADRNSFTMSEKGNEEKLTQTTTVKTVYFSACGEADCDFCSKAKYEECPDGVYGEIGVYKYPVPTKTTGGGGGGGGRGTVTVDNTRKYTKDIFGNEHPTHIGYINGYPDGSVQPDGDITREEITAILYRITNHEYEKPFVVTGEAFPDVEKGRWSARDIEYMADKEIVEGYPDGEFKPSRKLTRAEFAALIFRFTGISKSNIENPFTDLEKTHWAYEEILALTNTGLIEGYPDKTYMPEENITRAEVMTVINKLLGRKPLESYVKSLDFNPYNDLIDNKWYYVTVLEATITHNYWLDEKDGYEYKWEDWK